MTKNILHIWLCSLTLLAASQARAMNAELSQQDQRGLELIKTIQMLQEFLHAEEPQSTIEVLQNKIKALIDQNANINIHYNKGTTPLMHAVLQPETLQRLIDAGADINAQDNAGNTALIKAARNVVCFKESHQAIDLLLKAGADIDIANNDKITAYDFAKDAHTSEYLANKRELVYQSQELLQKALKERIAKAAETKQRMMQERKASIAELGQSYLPKGVAALMADYAIDEPSDAEVTARMHAEQRQIEAKRAQVTRKIEKGT